MNAKYVNGVAPGYWPTAGTGLVLNLSAGTAYCGNPPVPVSYPGGSLALTASTTNYIYLDPANNCSPAAGTSAFTAGEIPIATVVTGASSITSISDARTWFTPQPCVTGSAGDLECSSLGTNQNISLSPSGSGATVVTDLADKGGQVFNVKAYGAKADGTADDTTAIQAAIDAAGAAKGAALIPTGTYTLTGSITIPCQTTLEFAGAVMNFTLPSGGYAFVQPACPGTTSYPASGIRGSAQIDLGNTGGGAFWMQGGEGWFLGSAGSNILVNNVTGSCILVKPNGNNHSSQGFSITNIRCDHVAGNGIWFDTGNFNSAGYANDGIISNVRMDNGSVGAGVRFTNEDTTDGIWSFGQLTFISDTFAWYAAGSLPVVYFETDGGTTTSTGGTFMTFIGGEYDGNGAGTGYAAEADSAATVSSFNFQGINFDNVGFGTILKPFGPTLTGNIPANVNLEVSGGPASSYPSFYNPRSILSFKQTGGTYTQIGSVDSGAQGFQTLSSAGGKFTFGGSGSVTSFGATFLNSNLTAHQTFQVPNASGTLALQGGSCSMSTGTSCTSTVSYGSSCVATVQGATPIAAACQISGTTLTVTAASANSDTWAWTITN